MKFFRITTDPISFEAKDEVEALEKWLEAQKIIGLTFIQESDGAEVGEKKNIRFPLLNPVYFERRAAICLCGSTRFFKLFDEVNYKLTMKGLIVLSIGCHTQSDYCLGVDEIANAKKDLDELHKDKIKLADYVLVLDKDGYIGDSTRSEIEYATKLKRKIFYYSKGDLERILGT